MAKRRHRHRRQPDGVIGPALRPVAWSALLGAAMTAAAVTPAHAAPPVVAYAEPSLPDQVPGLPAKVPDAGARPITTGPLQLPGGPGIATPPLAPAPTTSLGPLAQRVTNLEAEVAGLGEQLKQLGIERQQIQVEVDTLNNAWIQSSTDLHTAETAAESAVEDAYKRVAGLPPGTIGSDLQGLGALSRLKEERPAGSENTQAVQLKRAHEAERAAYLAFTDATRRLTDANTRYTGLQTTFRQRERALLDLRQRNVSELAAIEREREAQEQRLGASYVGGSTVAGMQAHPAAKKAVQFALAQLGEPYLWGAEGPNRWDCSGLMWGAYRSAGQTLPRVSRDQYQATRSRQVARTALLPGDLVFFGTSPIDASQIHHVGMYIGGGKMVHAPTTGDVVKISTVWWSRFYAATRVVGAVAAPDPANPPVIPPTNPPVIPPTTPPVIPPTTPAPGPTTPAPGPTTPAPDPTTPAPDPTTPSPDPPTASPTPTPDPPDPPNAPTEPADPPADTGEPTGAAEPPSNPAETPTPTGT